MSPPPEAAVPGLLRWSAALALSDRTTFHAVTTGRADGDLRIDGDAAGLAARRAKVVDLPWVWVEQVHGAGVVTVTAADPGRHRGTEADALVSADAGVALAVHTADCVPLALVCRASGVLGVAHAGWRGVAAGVVADVAAAMRAVGASDIVGFVGPHVGVECYEFGDADLDRLVVDLGGSVRGRTAWGRPALSMGAAVAVAAERAGIALTADDAGCTACDADRWYSHRARQDRGRMATVVWRMPDDGGRGGA